MNQSKTGIYIAEKRKERKLTQSALAERLGITDRAVSKWERGLSLPDASLMLPLCGILGITVTELLRGEDMENDKFRESAEEMLLEMKRKEEEMNRYLLHLETVIGVLSTAAFIFICIAASLMERESLKIIFCILSFMILLPGVYYALKIEREAGYYECPSCHCRFVPDMQAFMFSPHVFRKRRLRCPECGKKSYMKKALTKD